MNLHAIVSGAINSVNPFVLCTLKRSDGTYTTTPAGERIPNYVVTPNVSTQLQELTQEDLKQLDGLNLQGSLRAIYMNGTVAGTVRATQKGGDLVITPDGLTWLCVKVLEQWPDWVKVAAMLQNDTP